MKCDLNYMEPFSRVYNHHGFQTGIIGVEPSDYEFLYMRYIQIYFSKSNNILEYGQDYFFENDNAFVKAFFSFPAEYWIKKLALADLQALINDGFYISGMWDEATVPGAKHYGKKRYWHNYMIIGYDEEEANFTCVGYDVKGQWERYKINYDVFITVTNENPIVHFEAIKRNSVFYKKFQLSEVKESMNTLLKGGMKKFFSDPEPCKTGLDACREFLEFEKLQGMNKKKDT